MARHIWFVCALTLAWAGFVLAPGCGPVPGLTDGGGWTDAATVQDTSAADTASPQDTGDANIAEQVEATPEVAQEQDSIEKAAARVTSVETKLATTSALAGELVVVTCSVLDQYGAPIAAQTKVVVDPAPKGFVKPTDVVIHEAGVYKVACQLVDGSLTDDTPETLTILSAEVATVDTELNPSQIRAGEISTVTCRVNDRFGNPVGGTTSVTVTPQDGITINGHQVSGTKLGQFLVACALGTGATALVDTTPAPLDITPGLPARIEVTPDPAKPYYKPDETILLERKVFDAYDNEVQVPHADIKVVSTSPTDVDPVGYPDSIVFKKDGEYQVTVSITSPTAGGKPVEETLTMKVDGYGPAITITSPARAVMLTGSQNVTVQGTVTDSISGLTSLQVNGKSVTPDSSGNFSTVIASKWGLNTLIIEATDKAGNAGYRAQSYLWSADYRAMGGAHVDRAALARLNQKGIDDGDRSTLNDLASLLELVLNGIDIDQEIPTTLASGKYKIPPFGPNVSYSVVKTSKVTMGKREITLTTRTGGLSVWAKVYDIRVPLKGSAAGFLNKSATVVADDVVIQGNIDIQYANGKVNVSIPSLSADVSKVEVKAFSGVFSFLNGAVTSLLRSSIKKALENAIKGALPDPVAKFFEGIKLARSFNLPAGLGGKTISLDSKLDYLTFDAKGGTLGLAASVTTTPGITDSKRGTPLRNHSLPSWGSNFAFGIGLSHNILNQLMTTAWISGALKQDISGTIQGTGSTLPLDPQGLKVKVEALLPPIIHTGTQGHDVDLGIGDLLLDVEFTTQGVGTVKATAYLSASFGTKLNITNQNEISFQLSPTPLTFAVDVVKISGLGPVNVGDLGKLIQALAPQITQFISSSILKQMPIPSIDLASLAGKYGIPSGTNLTLKKGSISTVGDYLQITGDL